MSTLPSWQIPVSSESTDSSSRSDIKGVEESRVEAKSRGSATTEQEHHTVYASLHQQGHTQSYYPNSYHGVGSSQTQIYSYPQHPLFATYSPPAQQHYIDPFTQGSRLSTPNPFCDTNMRVPVQPPPNLRRPDVGETGDVLYTHQTTDNQRVESTKSKVSVPPTSTTPIQRPRSSLRRDSAATKVQLDASSPPDIKPTDIVIAVMGITGSGKTTFVSHYADKDLEIGHGLESCTQGVDPVPCTFENNRPIWLIDTPGFDDTYRTDSDVLRELAQWLSTAYNLKIKLTGIIYLHRISDTRVGNAASRNLRMFKKLCGQDGLGSVVLATTMWSEGSSKKAQEGRESELQKEPMFWKNMIEKGSKVFRHDKGRKSAAEIINYLINKRNPVVLDIQTEMIEEKKKLVDTAAGAEVATDLERKTEKWSQELADLKMELREAIEKRDEDAKKEIREMRVELQTKLDREANSMQKLQADYDQLHQQMNEQYRKDLQELTDAIEANKKMLLDAQNDGRELQQQAMEVEKLRLEMRLKEQYYQKLLRASCSVM